MRKYPFLVAAAAVVAFALPRGAAAQGQDIVETATAAGNFKTFTRLLGEAGLTETLKGPGPFTVFAPSDEAFAKVSAERLSALSKDKSALRQVLLYHVVAGRLTAADLAKLNGKGTRTMELSEAKVALMGSTIMISNAHVTQADVAAKNGVIHIVDAVIMPPGR
jgi:uncharacterized surface protein with fasciclin (FAS1) repeats